MSDYYIGLLSGTSVDGIDAAIIDLSQNQINMVCCHEQAFSHSLKKDLQNIIKDQSLSLSQLSEIDSLLAFEFAQAVNILIKKSKIDKSKIMAIGSHGQTLFHQPDGNHPNTLQVGSSHKLAAMTGIDVVCNFRNLDMALEGQGAPLAPIIHQQLFSQEKKNTAVINLGGISNISLIGQNYKNIIGYDIGPANCLIDEWIHIHKREPFDNEGSWARQGQLNQVLLDQMLDDQYFSKPFPKSTGREYFNRSWYNNFIDQFKLTSAVDIQTTLTHLVAASIGKEVSGKSIDNIIVMGGGANNKFLIELIEGYSGIETKISSDFGYEPDWIEAILFAYLAKQRIENRKLDLSSITGSTKKLLVGDIINIS